MAEYEWAFSLIDSSRVSTFFISILLIVYGSFRSLNIEQEARERDKEKEKQDEVTGTSFKSSTASKTSSSSSTPPDSSGIQTLDGTQAVFLPIGASISLLIMFFFFDSMQMLFATCTAIIATISFAFLLLPMCQYLLRPCSDNIKMSFGCCGRFTSAEILSFSLSFCIVCIWVLTGHWLLMDALGMGLCVAFIAFIRLPSLKVSTLLLTGLLVYDVFWVFFSSYIFSSNVMVKVATRPAENPVGLVAKKLHLTGIVRDSPKLSLPGKLVFPSYQNSGHFSMLGLGDIVMPGLLLCFVLRYDAYKRSQLSHCSCCCCSKAAASTTSPSSSAATSTNTSSANKSSTSMTCEQPCSCPQPLGKSSHSEPSLSSTSPSSSSQSKLYSKHYYNCYLHHHKHYEHRHCFSHYTHYSPLQKITYFHCSLIGYFLGLLTATVSSEVFKAAQPALLYLVPFTLLPLLLMAYMKGDLKRMWHEPFLSHTSQPPNKYMDV